MPSGSWRPAFIVTGALGFLWLLLFRRLYYRPEEHHDFQIMSAYILEGRPVEQSDDGTRRLSYRTLLSLSQTWGIVIAKTLTDPVWFSSRTGSQSIL
jgi:ACS family hexuronate transporter-like MFS transporter